MAMWGEHASFASARAGRCSLVPPLYVKKTPPRFGSSHSPSSFLLHGWQLSKPASIEKLHKTTPPCTLLILHSHTGFAFPTRYKIPYFMWSAVPLLTRLHLS
ncbi:hypothetical protein GW17_00056114, partial [Ensete ventricosum]